MYNGLYVNSKVISGKNCVRDNANLFYGFGKKCLIVTSKSAAKKSGALFDVTFALDTCGIQYEVFDEVCENPFVSIAVRGGEVARKTGAEFVVGIGGGSVMDASKAVSLCACNPQLDTDSIYSRQVPSRALPLVLVGTTAGTGSEVTGVSVLTHDRTHQKKSIGGSDCYASLVFADPRYTYSAGYDVAVTTALDAFAHATEGWFSPRCDETARVFGKQALPRIYKGLEALLNRDVEPSEQVKDELYYGSLFAGLELNICGAAFPHTVGYILTESFGVPHGKACTSLMPYFLKKAKMYESEKFCEFLETIGADETNVINTVKTLTNVENPGVSREEVKKLCSRWGYVKNFESTPGGFTTEEAEIALAEIVCRK